MKGLDLALVMTGLKLEDLVAAGMVVAELGPHQ